MFCLLSSRGAQVVVHCSSSTCQGPSPLSFVASSKLSARFPLNKLDRCPSIPPGTSFSRASFSVSFSSVGRPSPQTGFFHAAVRPFPSALPFNAIDVFLLPILVLCKGRRFFFFLFFPRPPSPPPPLPGKQVRNEWLCLHVAFTFPTFPPGGAP